jgi:hypothetical protein
VTRQWVNEAIGLLRVEQMAADAPTGLAPRGTTPTRRQCANRLGAARHHADAPARAGEGARGQAGQVVAKAVAEGRAA